MWVSDPTWENHVAIFEGAGFNVETYPWFDSETNGVRVEALLEKLKTLPARSIVLLHPCCHNPTGADLTNDQWDAVIEVLKARNLIPFLDIAYQGFGAGMEDDAYAIRAVASAGLPVLVSNSFSKIFSCMANASAGYPWSAKMPKLPAACWASLKLRCAVSTPAPELWCAGCGDGTQ